MPKTIKTVGSRISVIHGNAKHTSGGLTKQDFRKNKLGKNVAIRASESSKKKFKANKLQKQSKETLTIMSGLPAMTLALKSKLIGRQITQEEVKETRLAAKNGLVAAKKGSNPQRSSERLKQVPSKKPAASSKKSKKSGSSKSKK